MGFHILEPFVEIKNVYKVKPNMKHQSKLPMIPNRYMQPTT
jgi:hypothetical protein